LETREVVTAQPETIKLENVVPPIRFESGVANVPESTVSELREVLDSMRHRANVRLNLVGHADDQPLSARLAERYEDNEGLSRERAGEVAEFFQAALELPPEAISYEWAGARRPVASNTTDAGRALNRRVEVEVWYDEFEDRVTEEEVVIAEEIRQVKICRMETVCKLRYVEGHARRARVQNLVAPLHYDEASLQVTKEFTAQIEDTLDNLRDKQNVVVKFIGYTDDLPLADRDARIYGGHESLSKARAHRVALSVQDRLGLPTEAVDSDGHGTTRALSSNETVQGRALNRRVEVEFWYDDTLQELPGEPQLCPADAAAETVTRVYQPPWGSLDDLQLVQGQAIIPEGYLTRIERALADVSAESRVRLRFVGYTSNERLDRRTAKIYGDDVGLSTARARRAMEAVGAQLGLSAEQTEHEGRGYLHSKDVINAGFIQGQDSYVSVEVLYDELAVLDNYNGVEVSPLTRELTPENPLALNLMRITVDGEPIDDPGRSSADVQRCTDVALQEADIKFGFDNLTSSPRLSVSASTETVQLHTINPAVAVSAPVRFRMYSNYGHFIQRAEVRVFDAGASTEADPLAVLAIGPDGYAEWRPDSQSFKGPTQELKYLLRAYGSDDSFDETTSRPLWIAHSGLDPAELLAQSNEADIVDLGIAQGESVAALSGYGVSALALQNIPLSSGTVRVEGSGLPPEREVWVAGAPVPVDTAGNFVSEAILPEGMHTVEVAVLDEEGSGELYLRDLKFEQNDWFYVGMADLTWSESNSSSNADLFVGEDPAYDYDSSLDGRLAFYATGKFGNGWGLTTSVDTREGELGSLFSNFLSREPDALFRRIDPDYHFPTFGDDGTVEELAPTQGKLYLKVNHDDNYGMWGNYQVGYMNNELAQVDRGLYGGQAHYQSEATTGFGEQKLAIDAFGAEPGTIPSRQEFRGTGGSFYYLRHQDILMGSERVRIEVRDKTSGIVTGVVNLSPSVDYDVDYLQGTILLTEPLAATVDDNLLVRIGATGGDEAHLVVRYEYTPGFEDIDALALGGQVHYWINDRIKVGLMANDNQNQDAAYASSLQAADLTLRLSSASWIKVQGGRSEGLTAQSLVSDDGGFGFQGVGDATLNDGAAGAYRGDLSIGLQDVSERLNGQLNLYGQTLEAGYSAPGLEAVNATEAYGGVLDMALTGNMSVRAKTDNLVQENGIQSNAHELNLGYQIGRRWDLSAGVRHDNREDQSPILGPTQDIGDRTDAVLQLGFDARGRWDAYGFVQDTISKSDSREANGRYGMGGSYLVSDKLRLDGEVSTGDLGAGGKVGTSYLHSDRTSVYLNYALENERTDNGLRSPRGSEGSLVTGMKTRFSDSTSIYLEERYQHGNSLTGLTHATGVKLTPTERLNLSANTDIGKLKDMMTGAETDRVAGGFMIGYGFESLQLSSGIEYRNDESQQIDASISERETWLYRNTFRWQLNPASRLLGKLNYSISDSSLGEVYDGKYTEAVVGYAFRPVRHDRLNALLKYTYFYNVPTSDQVTQSNVAAEYLQKSHVGALDLTYELAANWSIGGKYAYRLGSISLDREDPQFFDNSASLYVLRTDWRFRDKWELLLEGRLLDMPDLGEQRSGALVALSRYVGEHFKVGAGYNFTDFSDDLTDLNYDHHGLFLNLTGAL